MHHQPRQEEGGGGEEGAEHTGQSVASQAQHSGGEGTGALDTAVTLDVTF